MRIATFNVENLFHRYLFARGVDPALLSDEGFTRDQVRFRLADAPSKRLTADTIRALRADVIALQEVEGLGVLKQFRDRWLGGPEVWPHALLIDGNDPRGIDVGVLSRFPIVHARSWQHLRDGGRPVFDRDCLEVDIDGPGGVLTLYVNHFKSMAAPEGEPRAEGRRLTQPRRVQQSEAVMQIVRERFGRDPSDGAFVILGDLNDHPDDDDQGPSGVRGLVGWDSVEDVLGRLPDADRWTHYFHGSARDGLAPAYHQLDHVLLSRRLAALNPAPPRIERRGQPGRAQRYQGERFPGVGRDRPKASDHCPVVFDLSRLR